MLLFALVLCHSAFGLKIVPNGLAANKTISIAPGDAMYPFTLAECENDGNVTVKITRKPLKDAKEAIPGVEIAGKLSEVNEKLGAEKFNDVLDDKKLFEVRVEAKCEQQKKPAKFTYKIEGFPKIAITAIHKGPFHNVTFPLKYAKVKGDHADQDLKVEVEETPEFKNSGIEVKKEGKYIMFHRNKEGPPPELSFHLVENDSPHRSAKIVVPQPGKSHKPTLIQHIIFAIALALVVVMIAVLGIYYYRDRNAAPPADEERGAAPLFTSSAAPRQANVAADSYQGNVNVLDLRDAHAK